MVRRMQHLDRAGEFEVPDRFPNYYVEHVRSAAMSVGRYCVPAGGVDDQGPHPADEVYVVLSGEAAFEAGGRRVDAAAGTTLYVPAGEPHRFVDVRSDLTVLVVFAPPYTGRNPGDQDHA
jgi:mannose-6-phosphate isomerase-like protein (cupin superfamily)